MSSFNTPSILISTNENHLEHSSQYAINISTSPNGNSGPGSYFPITYSTGNAPSGFGSSGSSSAPTSPVSSVKFEKLSLGGSGGGGATKEEASKTLILNTTVLNNSNSNNRQNQTVLYETGLFHRGFGAFLKSSSFSDITVVINHSKRYSLHRVILSHSSKFFSSLFEQESSSSPITKQPRKSLSKDQECSVVINPDGEYELYCSGGFLEYFDSIVKYMYEGTVDLAPENALPILSLSNALSIRGLKSVAAFYLTSSITKENALAMLNQAILIESEDLISKCITVICKHFNQLISPNTIDPELLEPTFEDSNPISDDEDNQSSQTNGNGPTSTFIQYKINDKMGDRSLDPNTIHTIPELLSLPIEIMVRLMQQNNLSVSNEAIVYKTVLKYIQTNKEKLSNQDISSLFEVVRFPLFNFQQLEDIQDNPLIPRFLLTEALLQRLKHHEGPKSPVDMNNQMKSSVELSSSPSSTALDTNSIVRRTPRAAYSISLEYKHDFDNNGVFYYIGTNKYKEPWSNPALRGRVRITCSSLEKGNVTNCLGRDPIVFYTMDVPASWITVYLGSSRTMVPTYYTLRHGSNSKGDSIRNWTLQGSMDAKNWTVLVRHSNDASLNGNFSTCTWRIPNCTMAFRYFRILQTGRNSSNHNFLSVSNLEFYGDLYETRPQFI